MNTFAQRPRLHQVMSKPRPYLSDRLWDELRLWPPSSPSPTLAGSAAGSGAGAVAGTVSAGCAHHQRRSGKHSEIR